MISGMRIVCVLLLAAWAANAEDGGALFRRLCASLPCGCVTARCCAASQGIRGFIAAYHAETGKQAWRF